MTIADPQIPEGLSDYKHRELPDGSLLEYEERRDSSYRAYHLTPQPQCPACEGSGRAPSEKRPGGTIKCEPCKGTGAHPRQRLVSVSTLLDSICPKPGIPPWAEARGIEGAVEAMRRGEISPDTDPADAVKLVRLLKLGADQARDTAATRGLNLHGLLEDFMTTGTVPNLADHPVEHHGYLQGLCAFLLKNDPEPVAVEQLVCDPDAGYAGRRDLVAMVDGCCRVGFDAKTQERGGIYSSAHVQLQMYERAGIACGDEPCDRLVVVVFAANGEFREMACEAMPRTVEAALAYAREIRPIDSLCEGQNRAERKARQG